MEKNASPIQHTSYKDRSIPLKQEVEQKKKKERQSLLEIEESSGWGTTCLPSMEFSPHHEHEHDQAKQRMILIGPLGPRRRDSRTRARG